MHGACSEGDFSSIFIFLIFLFFLFFNFFFNAAGFTPVNRVHKLWYKINSCH